jgi:hypothetical protein
MNFLTTPANSTHHIDNAVAIAELRLVQVKAALEAFKATAPATGERMDAAKSADYIITDLIDELSRLKNEMRKFY